MESQNEIIKAEEESFDDNTETNDIEQKKNNYSIYEFFYVHPSVFIAVVTALLSFLSFFMNVLYYAFRNQKLAYWGLDIYLANVKVNFSFFSVFFVFGLIFSFCSILSTTASDAFFLNSVAFFRYRHYICQIINRQNSEEERDVNVCQNEERRIKKKLFFLYCSRSVKEFIVSILLSFVILWWAFILLMKMLPVFSEFKSLAVITIIVSACFQLSTFLIESFFSFLQHYKEIKAPITDIEGDDYVETYKRFPLVRLRNMRLRDFLCNSNIASFFRICSLVLLVIVVGFIILSESGIKNQKSFKVTDINGHKCAVLFQDESTCYGNRIIIKDDTLFISKTEHERMNNSNYSAHSYSFENVVIVDSLDEVFSSSEKKNQSYQKPSTDSNAKSLSFNE